jgi:dTDP-4-amino-4,6-dideoxygalactose transaminase
MEVPLVNLKKQYEQIRQDIEQPLLRFLQDQYFILGPAVEAFEREAAEYLGVKHAIGVSSGSDALLIALMALGIAPGDEVVTSTYTFFATAGAISRLGARPVFADIDLETFNLSPSSLETAVTPRTKAIIPVHLFGQCAPMGPILKLAQGLHIPVIEDAAQAMGAKVDGRQAGSMGLMGCFSFFPTKNLGGFGDGGMVVTSDAALGEKLKVLRGHGAKPKYHHHLVGGNFRLDAVQAFILSRKFRYLNQWLGERRAVAARYDRLFTQSGLVGSGKVAVPKEKDGWHTYNQYVIRVPRRDDLQKFLKQNGVDTAIYYPVPLHLQECFKDLGYGEGSFPESEKAARDSLAIPMSSEIEEAAQQYVVATVQKFLG